LKRCLSLRVPHQNPLCIFLFSLLNFFTIKFRVHNSCASLLSLHVLVTALCASNLICSFMSQRSGHYAHHPLYNNTTTSCLAFFLDCLTLADRNYRLSQNIRKYLSTYVV
jgi:hypothetical protein